MTRWHVVACLAAVLLLSAGRASASVYYGADGGSYVYIGSGTYGGWPGQWLVESKASGACAIFALGGPNGLSDNWRISLGRGNDFLLIIYGNGTQNVCGVTLSKPYFGNHYLDVYGNAGNDKLIGGDGETSIYGGDGHDKIAVANWFGAHGEGGAGNDIIYGTTSERGQHLYGDSGDDFLCDGRALIVNGGSGTDSALNGTVADALSSIEKWVTSCPPM